MNIVNDDEIQDYLLRLRDYGQFEKVRGDIDIPGLNSKMQELSAIVGLKNLEKVDFILSNRQKNVQRYLQFFKQLEHDGFVKTMLVDKEVICPYLYFPIILNDDATRFVEYMQENNIAVRRYYTANHRFNLLQNKYRPPGSFIY
ncbi:MAG: DegT/DnrJ/EryC1/StrS family aminotransferase [Saprospiraceae bacterium]|nr:DegT/DnrJ/EryC1/StrS family aminotransferase [Saprospiraceae bacterium]